VLPIINAIWIGKVLGPVHAACLRSFIRHGHRVVLHVFDRPTDVPEGVEFFDATRLMQRSEIVAYKSNGSLALAANIYRYRILGAGLGLYVDCDVFCLKPFPADEVVFGKESDDKINNAVLALPSSHPAVDELISVSSDPYFIPWWFRPKRQRRLKFRKAFGFPMHISSQPWGTTGPQLLTRVIERHKLEKQALPIDAFYAASFTHSDLLFEPGLSVSDLVTSRSLGIHLNSHRIKGRQIPAGSPLDEIIRA
jgi:hypothetical protein